MWKTVRLHEWGSVSEVKFSIVNDGQEEKSKASASHAHTAPPISVLNLLSTIIKALEVFFGFAAGELLQVFLRRYVENYSRTRALCMSCSLCMPCPIVVSEHLSLSPIDWGVYTFFLTSRYTCLIIFITDSLSSPTTSAWRTSGVNNSEEHIAYDNSCQWVERAWMKGARQAHDYMFNKLLKYHAA